MKLCSYTTFFYELDEFMVCQFLGILFVMVLKLGQLFL